MVVQYSEDVEKAMAEAQERIDVQARSLGHVCMAWSYLDRRVDSLFGPFLRCGPGQVAAIVSNLENMGSRCEILKRLAVLEAPSEPWRLWFVALLDRVSSELSPMRNRYIHDNWISKKGRSVRVDKRAKISKGQSRQPDRFDHDHEADTDAEELDRFTYTITAVTDALTDAVNNLRHWRKTGQPVEPDPRLLPASKPKSRYYTPQEWKEALELGLTPSSYRFD